MAAARKPSYRTSISESPPTHSVPGLVSRTRHWALSVCLLQIPSILPLPRGHVGPQLLYWLLRIAPLGGSRELLAIFQTPWKKGSCSQPRKCPLRDWLWFGAGFFSPLTVTLATFKFSGYFIVPSARSGDNLPLCWDREKLSSHNPGLVCVRAEHRFPHCYLGKRESRC